MTITILGTGLLGSGFARALLKKGEQVRVWFVSMDDFVLELKTEATEDRMLLAKIQPHLA